MNIPITRNEMASIGKKKKKENKKKKPRTEQRIYKELMSILLEFFQKIKEITLPSSFQEAATTMK